VSRKRSGSSARWLNEHENDPYVLAARKLGYRSRAVFKLKELDERDRLLKPGLWVADLGAAPGGWSQYARPRLGPEGRVFALDILPMDSLPEVDLLCGDFREPEVLAAFEAMLEGRKLDLVMSDMAPNLSGIDAADQASSIYLCELAQAFAEAHLRQGGHFLTKVFQGDGFDAFIKALRLSFASVVIRKPKASRPRSREVYVLARNFRRV
jgi:23S rRNA (uridine2552-2'-O)-methyltransferase